MAGKILVTGVAGMVGSHLTGSLLERGYSVTGVDNLAVGTLENLSDCRKNPRFEFHNIDILDFESLFASVRQGVDAIIHLAATKKISEAGSSLKTLSINAKGTENILNIARGSKAKVIFGSTSDVYGMSPDLPLHEDGDLLLGPSLIKRWSYAVAKLYGEQLAFGFYKEYDIPVVVLRYFGAFSPRASFSWSGGHVPIFIDAILKNEPVVVHGDGSQTRSMGYVTDLVEGTILALENPKAVGEIINIGNDEEMSVIDTAKLIHEMADTGKPLKIKYVPLESIFGQYKDIMRRIPDLTKAKKILGYRPKVSLREAIEKTLDERRRALRE